MTFESAERICSALRWTWRDSWVSPDELFWLLREAPNGRAKGILELLYGKEHPIVVSARSSSGADSVIVSNAETSVVCCSYDEFVYNVALIVLRQAYSVSEYAIEVANKATVPWGDGYNLQGIVKYWLPSGADIIHSDVSEITISKDESSLLVGSSALNTRRIKITDSTNELVQTLAKAVIDVLLASV